MKFCWIKIVSVYILFDYLLSVIDVAVIECDYYTAVWSCTYITRARSFSPSTFLSPRHAVIKQIINVIAIGAKENANESQSPAGAYRYAMVARR